MEGYRTRLLNWGRIQHARDGVEVEEEGINIEEGTAAIAKLKNGRPQVYDNWNKC